MTARSMLATAVKKIAFFVLCDLFMVGHPDCKGLYKVLFLHVYIGIKNDE